MTDRLFADCCYGTDRQHGTDEPCPIPSDLTPRDVETLVDLVRVYEAHLPNNLSGYQSSCPQTSRGNGASPLDIGGSNGSHHSYTLTKLARKGYAEHRQRGAEWGDLRTIGARGSKVYRPTEKGRAAAVAFVAAERRAAAQ